MNEILGNESHIAKDGNGTDVGFEDSQSQLEVLLCQQFQDFGNHSSLLVLKTECEIEKGSVSDKRNGDGRG